MENPEPLDPILDPSPNGRTGGVSRAIVWINGVPHAPMWGYARTHGGRSQVRARLDRWRDEPGRQVHLDRTANRLLWRGVTVRLTPHQFQVLACLVAANGSAVSRGQLLKQVWGQESGPRGDDLLRAHISGARKALKRAGLPATLVQNVWGGSYRICIPDEEALAEVGS